MKYVIVIPGDPVAKGRPRFGNGRAFTPPKTRAYEEAVCEAATRVFAPFLHLEHPVIPAATPLELLHVTIGQRPGSLKGDARVQYRPKRPDFENLTKTIDGIMGVGRDLREAACELAMPVSLRARGQAKARDKWLKKAVKAHPGFRVFDDGQIVEARILKLYAADGQDPMALIVLRDPTVSAHDALIQVLGDFGIDTDIVSC